MATALSRERILAVTRQLRSADRGRLLGDVRVGSWQRRLGKAIRISCLTVSLLAINGAQALGSSRIPLPLRRLELERSLPAIVEETAEGFVINNPVAMRGEVVCPPDAFACRLTPGTNPDIVQLAIGSVSSLRCNALYSPRRDYGLEFESPRVELQLSGRSWVLKAIGPLRIKVYRDYMKTYRGLKWFRPLDKTVFRRAPAGWCSWYIYWQGVTEEEVVKNTDWLTANLKQFGCEFVQIDDGWQGKGHGGGENRDWYVTDRTKFPHGMKWLADYIRARGLRPGIWVIPFATSNEELFQSHPELFIRNPDGSSIGETRDPTTGTLSIDWTGRYIVDPTSDAGQQ